jgi:ESAT-6 family protein
VTVSDLDYRFDFNQADAVLYDMNRINGTIKTGLEEMQRNAERSLETWTGGARAAYYEAKLKWNASADQMTVYLEQARTTLLAISGNYGNTETRHTKIWNDVRGG